MFVPDRVHDSKYGLKLRKKVPLGYEGAILVAVLACSYPIGNQSERPQDLFVCGIRSGTNQRAKKRFKIPFEYAAAISVRNETNETGA